MGAWRRGSGGGGGVERDGGEVAVGVGLVGVKGVLWRWADGGGDAAGSHAGFARGEVDAAFDEFEVEDGGVVGRYRRGGEVCSS